MPQPGGWPCDDPHGHVNNPERTFAAKRSRVRLEPSKIKHLMGHIAEHRLGSLRPEDADTLVRLVWASSKDPQQDLFNARLVEARDGGNEIEAAIRRLESAEPGCGRQLAPDLFGRGLSAIFSRRMIEDERRAGHHLRSQQLDERVARSQVRHYARRAGACGATRARRASPRGFRRSPGQRPRRQTRADDGASGSDGPGEAARIVASTIRALVPLEGFDLSLVNRAAAAVGVNGLGVIAALGEEFWSEGLDAGARELAREREAAGHDS